MAKNTGTTSQTTDNQNSMSSGFFRDVNASLGSLDLLNNFGAATSSATSGAVEVGDKIVGGSKQQLGIIKILAVFAGVAILLKIYQGLK